MFFIFLFTGRMTSTKIPDGHQAEPLFTKEQVSELVNLVVSNERLANAKWRNQESATYSESVSFMETKYLGIIKDIEQEKQGVIDYFQGENEKYMRLYDQKVEENRELQKRLTIAEFMLKESRYPNRVQTQIDPADASEIDQLPLVIQSMETTIAGLETKLSSFTNVLAHKLTEKDEAIQSLEKKCKVMEVRMTQAQALGHEQTVLSLAKQKKTEKELEEALQKIETEHEQTVLSLAKQKETEQELEQALQKIHDKNEEIFVLEQTNIELYRDLKKVKDKLQACEKEREEANSLFHQSSEAVARLKAHVSNLESSLQKKNAMLKAHFEKHAEKIRKEMEAFMSERIQVVTTAISEVEKSYSLAFECKEMATKYVCLYMKVEQECAELRQEVQKDEKYQDGHFLRNEFGKACLQAKRLMDVVNDMDHLMQKYPESVQQMGDKIKFYLGCIEQRDTQLMLKTQELKCTQELIDYRQEYLDDAEDKMERMQKDLLSAKKKIEVQNKVICKLKGDLRMMSKEGSGQDSSGLPVSSESQDTANGADNGGGC